MSDEPQVDDLKDLAFLRPDQVREISDLDALQQELDRTMLIISFIRADLEFPKHVDADGNIDPVWDKKARAALGFGMTAKHALEWRIQKLSQKSSKGPPQPVDPSVLEAETIKLERDRIGLERQKLNVEKDRIQLNRHLAAQKAELIKSTKWERCFIRIAKQRLPPALWAELVEAADAEQVARAEHEFSEEVIDRLVPRKAGKQAPNIDTPETADDE